MRVGADWVGIFFVWFDLEVEDTCWDVWVFGCAIRDY